MGVPVVVESGLGGGIGYGDDDYRRVSPLVTVADQRRAFAQDVVLVLRAPEERFTLLRPGAALISMLHFPTRPGRVRRLKELRIDAISLDSIADDDGRRLVENTRAVGWNGLEAAFDALAETYPALTDPGRPPVRVTVLGAGTVGKHAVEAATKYGNLERAVTFDRMGLPGVEVTVLGRNITANAWYMPERLSRTDILVDATQRSDPTRPLIPNGWLGYLPAHAIICDLVVDPYLLDSDPPTVRSIEGIPQGNLDQWTYGPEDPGWDTTIPACIPSRYRRTVVSCYSWPGVHPEECMRLYGRQVWPLLRTLILRGGVQGLRPQGGMLERALRRGSLEAFASGLQPTPRLVGAVA
jgi:alanine dehydrogenase